MRKYRSMVKDAFKRFKGRYGSPRIYIYLKNMGLNISENTVAKLMNEEGLAARKKKNFKVVSLDEKVSSEVHDRIFKIEEIKSLNKMKCGREILHIFQ